MKQEPKQVKCEDCNGDGKLSMYDHIYEQECWYVCPTCQGEGTIPDPDDFTNTLSDLVQAKEKTYEQD